MVEKINSYTRQYNYNTINSVTNSVKPKMVNTPVFKPSFTASGVLLTPQTGNIELRTELCGEE